MAGKTWEHQIGIIDYGMGNLRSVQKAFAYLGFSADIISDPAQAKASSRLILPGVGAFHDAIARLRETEMDKAVLEAAAAGKPILGICLGMQMMFSASVENGWDEGLGIFPGTIERLQGGEGLKIPHMGWNTIETKPSILFTGEERPAVYFVHSYCASEVTEVTSATCEYGQVFTAAVERGNVCATQFHPEKSGDAGLAMLRRFATWEGEAC
ncbi:MAG: imidazole glycerol phosphate synthase subunit HisH [Clostridia bacterium]|nr:imidazole glycerol phosphate synthase subunit HisH [Clostridia bacterium]MBR2287839.1 imidazole glycerol phosphate synthase subunit HisH [Clostridia bacterium]